MTATLLLDERTRNDGSLERVYARADGGVVELVTDLGVIGRVPVAAVVSVLRRYGRPLADDVEAAGPTLPLGDGCTLQAFRHRAHYDVIAKDFVVLRAPGEEPLAELATAVAGALEFLAASYARAGA